MTTIDFQALFDLIKKETSIIAVTTFKQLKKEAESDAENLLENLKQNLQNWTIQLAAGELSKEDFEFLVMGQKDLIEMSVLKQKGIALIKLDELKINLIKQIIDTIFATI